MTSNKTADKITKFSKALPQNSSETVTNETKNIEKIPKERYLSLEMRQKTVDDLRLI